MFSKFFIDRPIFATVIAILMIIAGLLTGFFRIVVVMMCQLVCLMATA